jgi:hypothetical protein
MIGIVPGGIRNEGETTYGISVDFVVEVEKDTGAGVCKDGVRRFGENVIVRKTFFSWPMLSVFADCHHCLTRCHQGT